MSLISKFTGNSHIQECYETIKLFEMYVGEKKIKVKIKCDNERRNFYETSHFYHGSKQAGPYISSQNGFETIDEACHYAKLQITSFYDPSDDKAKWIINDDF